MKRFLLFWAMIAMALAVSAQERSTSNNEANNHAQRATHVTATEALNVGYTFMRTSGGTRSSNVSKQSMQLIYTGQAIDSVTQSVTDCYYVFALQPKGFVIVAADNRVEPILGYSYDNNFAVANMPEHVRGWLGNYEKQIEAVVKQDIAPEAETTTKWSRLRAGQAMSTRSGESVGPLLTTQWDQVSPFNDMCPYDEAYGARCPVGCTATAIAQIMNYWHYPEKGTGYNEFQSDYGWISVSFSDAVYQWDEMDDNHPNELAQLSYHIGVAADMDYSPSASGANFYAATSALINNFDYSDSLQFIHASNLLESSLIQESLYDSIPVLFQGPVVFGLHAWVIDGLDENGLYHFNYGWGGSSDGYYTLDYYITGQIPSNCMAVVGIRPAHSPLDARMGHKFTGNQREVRFVDESKGIPDSCVWQISDGSIIRQHMFLHTFETTGTFMVTLTAYKDGESSIVTDTITIEESPFIESGVDIVAGNYYTRTPPLALDADLDGKLDLFVTGRGKVYYNRDTTFLGVDMPVSIISNTASIVDVEKQNIPSVISSGDYGSYYLHNTGSEIIPITNQLANLIEGASVLAIGDYDGDGEDDALIDYILYRNIGNGNYKQVSQTPFESSLWYDYDGDGDLDLIGRNIYRNDGDDVFVEIARFETPMFFYNQCFPIIPNVADMNRDGFPDFVFGNYIVFYYGNDSFVLSDNPYLNESDCDPYEYKTSSADITGNGFPDIIGNFYESADVYASFVNDGEQLQRHPIYFRIATRFTSSLGCLFDYNNDNMPDLFVCGANSPHGRWRFFSFIYRNSSNVVNNPPSAPENLWADTVGNSVTLHWDTVGDDHSVYGSITYNLMIGTSPDSFDVKSPLSNIETGKRYAYNIGNAGHAPLWKLNNLRNGTYYWRVQAIDNSLAASQFSEMGSFVINGMNYPPEIADYSISASLNRDNYLSAQDIKDLYSDREGDTIQGVQIVSLPFYGSLVYDNVPVSPYQQISINDIGKLSYRTSVSENDTFYIKAYNQYGYSQDSVPVAVNVKIFQNTFALNDVNGDVVWGDFDNDGKLDFASTIGIYHNTGNGFERLSDSIPQSEHVLCVDINNDGYLDIMFDGYILLNTTEGHFVWNGLLTELSETGAAVGDINNDNKADYYLSGGFISHVYYNTADGWTSANYYELEPGYRTGSAAFGDINNDGWQDLVTIGVINEGNNVRETNLYLNQESILNAIQNSFVNVNVGSVAWGDYDNDGDLDLLVCGSKGTTSNIITLIYDNYGSGTFIEQENTPFAPLFQGEAVWYDFDNDGYLDVLLSGMNSGTRLYRNINGNHFEEVNNTSLPDLSYSHIDVADYDGDGFEDIIISGIDNEYMPYTGVFSNGNGDGVYQDSQISVPMNLEANVQGSSVTLSWNDNSSATYNIYVKNTDGFIVSPLADITTGFRKVTGIGNTGCSKSYTLRGLPAGTYQWSVQTVDKTHKGGTFALEQSFDITCNYADTTIIYDTVCYALENGHNSYTHSGIYYEYYLDVDSCDSIVKRHLTINQDCSPTIYVREDGDNTRLGFSWESALSDLQLALDRADEINGQVWVAQGTYFGDGVSEDAFIIPNGVQIYGGFAGDEPADYDLSLRDFKAHPTVLDGQHVQRTVYYDWTWDSTPVLDGFTIQNGYTDSYGANIYGGNALLVNNCIIRYGESAVDAGGAAYAIVTNSVIYNNIGHNWAGGIFNSNATNCVLVNNTADVSAAAFSTMTNCILWNNGGWDQELSNTFTYSAIQDWSGGGEWNIALAHNNDGTFPDSNYVRFVDPDNGDFCLAYGSACINAGTPDISELGLPSVDLKGLPRVLDGRIDMGAYEYYPVPVVETYDTICEGNSIVFFDSVCSAVGRYLHHTSVDEVSLDTLYMLHLEINPVYSVDSIIPLPENGYVKDGQTYTQSGVYSFNYTTVGGCDSIINIILYDSILALCENQLPYIYGEMTFDVGTTSGLYPVMLNGQNLFVYLRVNPAYYVFDTIFSCDNQWYWIGDVCLHDSISGDYQFVLQSNCGCDSVVNLHYTVNPSYWFELYDTIPRGMEYSANGFYFSAEETQNARQLERYNWNSTSAGCDSTCVLHLTLIGDASIRYVAQNGTGDGSSWENAMGDLQAAMDSAALVQGDVWVAEGTYYGDGVSENAFTMHDGVHVFGGFAGNEPADYDLSLRDFNIHPTILDGQHVQRTVYHGWTWGQPPLMDGLTIQNGYSNSDDGGNVYGGTPRLQMTNCIVQGGVVEFDAGGAVNVIFRNSLIINNTSTYWGSAMKECDAYNCVISGNNATEYGYTNIWSTLTNCIVWNNVGNLENSCSLTYSAVEGQEVWGEGNIMIANNNDGSSPDSNYVRFVDPENGDFRLVYGSACINAGIQDISDLGLPSVDLQGLPRVLDGRIDMGAYEYYPVPVVETYDAICEGNSIVFFDSVYTVAGSYVHHTHAEDVTLDTLYVLNLAVNHATFGDTTAVACESFTWIDGETYTESTNEPTYTLTNAAGCDSVVTLNLTVNYGTHNAETEVACDSYEWHGETYTTSGMYTYEYTNADGCPSVDTLYLTCTYLRARSTCGTGRHTW